MYSTSQPMSLASSSAEKSAPSPAAWTEMASSPRSPRKSGSVPSGLSTSAISTVKALASARKYCARGLPAATPSASPTSISVMSPSRIAVAQVAARVASMPVQETSVRLTSSTRY